jgi:hypothetical protein
MGSNPPFLGSSIANSIEECHGFPEQMDLIVEDQESPFVEQVIEQAPDDNFEVGIKEAQVKEDTT